MIGQKLGCYEITDPLGKGGMGEVWKARDSKLERDVAIKTLPEEFAADRERLARFQREARVLASLNHPNIAAIYGLEEAGGTHFLVLEFVEGESLAERLDRGPMPLEESLRVASQLVEALESAHAKGVVHRDLKPANIKITPEGTVKVLDFGLAKAMAGDGAVAPNSRATVSLAATLEGVIIGTPGYMSPEQARGEATDKRTDIWSFGCVLFEMLTGQETFPGRTLTDALAGVIAREPEWNRLPPNLHPRLRLLLERCLEKDPGNRYHDAAEARVDIETVLADPRGVYAAPAETTARRPAVVPWVVAGIAVLAAISTLVWESLGPERPLQVTRFVASSYPSPPVELGPNLADVLVSVSPDGTEVAYPAVVDGEPRIYMRNVSQLEGRPLRTAGLVSAPFFSPDGGLMAFINPVGRTLQRATVHGSESPETFYTYPAGTFPFGASWGPDETVVLALFNDSAGLLRIPVRGGEVETLTTPDEGEDHFWPDVLPGGRAVLFTSGVLQTAEYRIGVLDLDTREARFLIDSGSQARYLGDGIIVYHDAGALRAIGFDPDRLETVGSPVQVLDGIEWNPATGVAQFGVSPAGHLVWVNARPAADTNRRTLALVDPTGRREDLDVRVAAYLHPRVSPDGTQIAVQTFDASRRGIVWIYDLERRTQRQLTTQGSNVRPIWTPDGERITFASNRDGAWGIYWQRADGSDVPERLTTADPGMEHYPDSWHPDGARLAFTNIDPDNTPDQSIWLLDLGEGSEPALLKERISGGSAFSPNGRWIAYRSNVGGRANQLYAEPFPQTGVVYQITQDEGSSPVWSRDGTRLVYRRSLLPQEFQRSPLVAMDVTTEERFTFGNEQLLPIEGFMTFFGYRDYDFMPDGNRLVMVFPVGEDITSQRFVPRVNVALNWTQELKGRIAAP